MQYLRTLDSENGHPNRLQLVQHEGLDDADQGEGALVELHRHGMVTPGMDTIHMREALLAWLSLNGDALQQGTQLQHWVEFETGENDYWNGPAKCPFSASVVFNNNRTPTLIPAQASGLNWRSLPGLAPAKNLYFCPGQ